MPILDKSRNSNINTSFRENGGNWVYLSIEITNDCFCGYNWDEKREGRDHGF